MSIQTRLFNCASLAGPYVDAGLEYENADAHYGLIHGTIDSLLEFAKTIPGWKNLPLVSLITLIVQRHDSELSDRAAVLQWAARKAAYDADCASWKKIEQEKGINWRTKPMTDGQRHCLADTAHILKIEFPEGMNRGAAADWLDANGAHVILRLKGAKA